MGVGLWIPRRPVPKVFQLHHSQRIELDPRHRSPHGIRTSFHSIRIVLDHNPKRLSVSLRSHRRRSIKCKRRKRKPRSNTMSEPEEYIPKPKRKRASIVRKCLGPDCEKVFKAVNPFIRLCHHCRYKIGKLEVYSVTQGNGSRKK